MTVSKRKTAALGVAAVLLACGLYWSTPLLALQDAQPTTTKPSPHGAANAFIELTDAQAQQIQVRPVETGTFAATRDAVGNIAFNDDRTVPVFPSYQGKISAIFTDVGQDVQKGAPLYAVESPDLLQAESTLISTAGVRDLTQRALERAQQLYGVQGISEKDLQQAISDQQSAEGAYKAARDAVRIFGKTDVQMDQIVLARRVDATLLVTSPVSGRVVNRSAAPGILAQPGTPPAPFTVADISTLWMIANVSESDAPALRLGQPVEVTLMAYPGRTFQGKITNIGAAVDPGTHRLAVRAEIRDPQHELRPGMLANFAIQTGVTAHSPSVPADSVVRENDGTMSVWVTTDRHRFYKRTVTLGLQQGGQYQILNGIQAGENVATEGAIFLSHTYEAGTH
ncbi:MAG: efflux RND transporter periplasmic adaptor subunit [Betaproteobacteria bacterium]|nr:efflux RND transporter periplasmic adaptor subunit [Betaproteobacteria bacterium]MDE2131677.1 efflux RND transporter periplasmic adaptor subunit [Betaproteobacteria bacterium]MDE2212067.1 efflux RND transporter periplasmic adaptor subunit [Betaproteobacteria bacterium]